MDCVPTICISYTVHGEMPCLRKSPAWVLKWVNWQKAATPAAEIFEQVKKDIESSLSYFGPDYTIKEKKIAVVKGCHIDAESGCISVECPS